MLQNQLEETKNLSSLYFKEINKSINLLKTEILKKTCHDNDETLSAFNNLEKVKKI
jgi:hypothetical protein